MRLNIKLRVAQAGQELHDAIERRVRFALSRFGNRIQRTEVVLADVNGMRGGVDQSCRLRVVLPALAPVVVEVTDVEPLAAVGRAADRAARHVRDSVNRRRDLRRHYGVPPARSAG